MRAMAVVGLICVAALTAGCATLRYDGMPDKSAPHAMAVEDEGIKILAVDGRDVERPAFALSKLLLAPGRHELLVSLDSTRTDTDYIGDLEIQITVHYWSRFAQVIGFAADEGYRYYIGADAKVPTTEVSYETWRSELPPDYPTDTEGRVSINIDHELTEPDDWRPLITRRLPIKKYWRTHTLPTAAIKGAEPSSNIEAPVDAE